MLSGRRRRGISTLFKLLCSSGRRKYKKVVQDFYLKPINGKQILRQKRFSQKLIRNLCCRSTEQFCRSVLARSEAARRGMQSQGISDTQMPSEVSQHLLCSCSQQRRNFYQTILERRKVGSVRGRFTIRVADLSQPAFGQPVTEKVPGSRILISSASSSHWTGL